MNNNTIVLTGGGTAGHVSLNEAIIPELIKKGYKIHYIGSYDGIEKTIIQENFPTLPYHSISNGKLRRYFSVKNFSDPFKVLYGTLQALSILRKVKPSIVFSKGGFVSVPVAIAAKLANIPVVIHESDLTPGLANKIASSFAEHIFTVFEETLNYLPKEKASSIGAIIRPDLFFGNEEVAERLTGFQAEKNTLIIMGGSQGSAKINEVIKDNIEALTSKFQIIHLCGKGNLDATLTGKPNYIAFEYVTDELPHLLKISDYVISRAGSNSIFEFLELKKPMLLIPLSIHASRGDQVLNANFFENKGYALKLEEEHLTTKSFMDTLSDLVKYKEEIIDKQFTADSSKTPDQFTELLLTYKK
ncbi:undecaprenyldiphospho-muramoylpentapeptide beta-N-acetylglucosaminyltransferase [Psychrobacillus lasiicapitis]|uniref:UDP-N-acetylglucosamine--N-acetylmuramyl-(pentapeptide) pyrophosphoryl-undecaprenol N-acetylglucosamine transferase n=1 Tax=Psychrobacillus lasiicapitis TaxID=1636719 RepID=A0A544THB0_9BACI|nr:undecaprenyldiphospho-muramoylpentapeptide beta-N-acetylglucosaminyltransferase [Psychrobacillus lasiicapitis]TQR16801.1 undecaprenyldiphospho-muramoylpentapeptide beta-N-acetylglucosaminyltransferase [Psychrobacillus lasiicapitis]GGA27097.1 UDP-N-acetylglucosamine--N-acetylmuramyl-(pentapeptide) pyrophosphoryl-undecaprenol N-acetylglucosamine transferase [Psychrobacillus lasiicapitis]